MLSKGKRSEFRGKTRQLRATMAQAYVFQDTFNWPGAPYGANKWVWGPAAEPPELWLEILPWSESSQQFCLA